MNTVPSNAQDNKQYNFPFIDSTAGKIRINHYSDAAGRVVRDATPEEIMEISSWVARQAARKNLGGVSLSQPLYPLLGEAAYNRVTTCGRFIPSEWQYKLIGQYGLPRSSVIRREFEVTAPTGQVYRWSFYTNDRYNFSMEGRFIRA